MNNTTEHINSKLIAMAHHYIIPKALLKVHYLNEITKINHFNLQNYYRIYHGTERHCSIRAMKQVLEQQIDTRGEEKYKYMCKNCFKMLNSKGVMPNIM